VSERRSVSAADACRTARRRWVLGGLLFLVTVINYVDRQVFSILAPELQDTIGWTELDYSRIVNAFQFAYAITMVLSGRVLDRIGARIGLAASVVWWSLAEAAHALARTPLAFGFARFALGVGEAANFPAALKAVTELFRPEERALATGLFNSGVAFGTVTASIGVPLLSAAFGWRATFVATGALGLLWLPFWWLSYRSASPTEAAGAAQAPREPAPSWRQLLRTRQTWAYALTKSLGDPIWWFYLFWLPKYLAAQFHVRGTAVIPYLTAVYVAADIGCLVAGGLSSALVRHGFSLNGARKGTMALLALIMTPTVIVAGSLDDPRLAIALIAVACGAHQAWSTMVFTVATDLFPRQGVGSVSGFGGFVAGMVSIGAAELIGRVLNTDATLYRPIFVAAGLLYPIALGVLHWLSPRLEPARLTMSRIEGSVPS
jgi:ACS family hexuronate transporter-like MFS transporter